MEAIKPNQTQTNPKQYYDEHGYYIFRNLVPAELIDDCLEKYRQDILPSGKRFFRQSSNRWKFNRITSKGYCQQSFLDIHDYPEHSELNLRILCSEQVRTALQELTGADQHNLMQSMFFDLNAATPAHQDWYYLDSMPNGYLLAGWFALEDIHEEAGRFYVLPGSHLIDFELNEDEKIANSSYVSKLKAFMADHSEDIYAPALKKGDVLFWNSRTIHGSLETVNPAYSRKSLTAHYLPSSYQFGKRHQSKPKLDIEYFQYAGMKCRMAPLDHKVYSLKNYIKTEVFQFMWEHPKLAKAYSSIKRLIAR